MILTRAQRAGFERAKVAALNVLPTIEFLDALGRVDSRYAERARELRTERDLIYELSVAALQFDEQVANDAQRS